MSDLTRSTTLHNGVKMPWVGFGTFRIPPGDATKNAVLAALNAGYRHIDTAKIYGNEQSVGEAIRESGIKREDIFVVTKLWNADQGYDSTLRAFEESLKNLGMDYVDLYLIHWPKDKNQESWKAMEKLYKEKCIRAIGVSNFKIHHLETLMAEAEVIPMVNQVECHPQFPQDDVLEFCKKHQIQLEAWGPLMQGKIFDKQVLIDLAKKYNRTVAQIALRWQFQRGVVVIPRSTKPERLKQNSEIFDFELSHEDMELIKTLKGNRISHDPDHINF